MTVFVLDAMIDADLDFLIANGQKVHLLTAYNNSYATITGANGSMGSFVPAITKADNDGAGGGRKAIIAAASGIAIATVVAEVDETFTHYAVLDDTNSRVIYVGEGTNKLLSNGDTVSTPIFNVRSPDGITTPA